MAVKVTYPNSWQIAVAQGLSTADYDPVNALTFVNVLPISLLPSRGKIYKVLTSTRKEIA